MILAAVSPMKTGAMPEAQASIVGFAQAVEALEKLAYSISVLYVDDGSFFHTIHMAR